MPKSFEAEIRARVPSEKRAQQIKQRLAQLGFQDIGEKRVRDAVYGLHGMYSVKWDGFCYRVREYGDKLVVDRKGTPSKNLEEGFWREEVIPAKSRPEAHRKLAEMGLHPYLVIDRARHEFRKGNIHIAVDNVANLGHFIEAEQRIAGRQQLANAKKQLAAFLEKLGVKRKHFEPRPYGWLFALKFRRDIKGRQALARELGVKPAQIFPKKKVPRKRR